MNNNHKKYLMDLAQTCRNARLIARIRVNEMAKLTGYSTGTIERFERGENNNLVLYMYYVKFCKLNRKDELI